MPINLDERAELTMLVDVLNYNDQQKLSIFITGLEAGRGANRVEHPDEQNTAVRSTY